MPASGPDFRRLRTPLRASVLAVALAACASPALALSLGNAEVTSYLGQPLQMRVPVIIDDPSDGSTQCPRLIAQPSYDVPTLAMGRMDIERSVTQTYLRLTTALPVDEPVLRVVLEIGCTQRVRREYTLLLDPPAGVAGSAPAVVAAPRIEFGRPHVLGYRGQPLMMTVPITGELVSSLTQACVHSGRSDSREKPRVLNEARVTLIDDDGGRALRIHTPNPVNDSRVRVLVEVGCDQPVRKAFTLLLDAPRLASTAADEIVPLPAPAPPRRIEKPPVRAALPSPPPVTPSVALEVPATQKADVSAPPAPAPVAPPEPAKSDRLVLAAPDEAPKAGAPGGQSSVDSPRPGPSSDEREQVLERLEVLAAEVKTLRAELDASDRRNRELSEQARSASYAWAAAAGAALLLGIGIFVNWRSRPRYEEPEAALDDAGPMTRILGKPTEKASAPAPAVPPPAMTEGAGPDTVAAIVAAHKAAHEQETQGASTAIMVTEFRDTTQVIGELYSPYVERSSLAPAGPATQPPQVAAPASASDLDLGNERTTMYAPNTKTEIAVDIDVFERNSQIGRDLQREYERLDLVGRAKQRAETPPTPEKLPESELPTKLDTPTVPMTTKLALDLDLDLDISTLGQPKTPDKGA